VVHGQTSPPAGAGQSSRTLREAGPVSKDRLEARARAVHKVRLARPSVEGFLEGRLGRACPSRGTTFERDHF